MLSGGATVNSSRAKLFDIMVAVTIVISSFLQNSLVTIMTDRPCRSHFKKENSKQKLSKMCGD
jgi:hypothetical protein